MKLYRAKPLISKTKNISSLSCKVDELLPCCHILHDLLQGAKNDVTANEFKSSTSLVATSQFKIYIGV